MSVKCNSNVNVFKKKLHSIHSLTKEGMIIDANICNKFLLASLPSCTFR